MLVAWAVTMVKAAGGLLALALVRPWGRRVAGMAADRFRWCSMVLIVYGGFMCWSARSSCRA